MRKEFVNYEQALALDKLKFDEECLAWYNCDEKSFRYFNEDSILDTYAGEEARPYAPLRSQAFRFFRETHKLHHTITMTGTTADPNFMYIIFGSSLNDPDHMFYYEHVKTYEEAENGCLNKLIKLCSKNL